MTVPLLFVTSPKATTQTIRELQLAEEDYPVATRFSPAFFEAPAHTITTRVAPDVEYDLFEDYNDDQLRSISMERSKTDKGITGASFVVLDDRGVQTKTVVAHCYYTQLDHEETSETLIEQGWYTWRVAFEDVGEMLDLMDIGEIELFLEVHSKPEDFTDAEGIYRPKEGQKARYCG